MTDDDLIEYQLSRRGALDSTGRTAWFAPRCRNPECQREWHGLPYTPMTGFAEGCPGSHHFD